MDANPIPDPELTAIEGRLAAWRPSAEGLDRDRLLFAAGRASATRDAVRLWRGAAIALAILLASLGGFTIQERAHHERRTQELRAELAALQDQVARGQGSRTALAEVQPTPSPEPVIAPSSYLDLTQRLASGQFLDPPHPGDRFTTPGLSPALGRPLRPTDSGRLLDL